MPGLSVRVRRNAQACGDGELSAREMCDDGNVEAGDGCDSRCRIESDWVCSVEGGACSRCGNCLLEDGEECDDGNTTGGDGCSSTCRAESGYFCLPLEDYWGNGSASNCVWAGECGDGRVSAISEACDDGNADSGDGCSGDCSSVETGYVCHEPGLECERIAGEHPHCGDGEVQSEYGEECDDGVNDGSEDGCAMDCRLPYCGDGQLQPESGEECDDGSNSGAYGECGSGCHLAPLNAADACMVLNPYCGDGVLQTEFEECDDGADNGSNGHCEVDCTLGRPGYCGDGIVDEGYEECDDGNWVSCDGCSSFCGTELPAE